MGNCVGGFFKKRARVSTYWGRNKCVPASGLDGAGKTTVVKALQGDDFGNVYPTVGFSRAVFTLHRCRVTAYDLGGGERIRDIWTTYYAEVHGVVYVVDSAASSRLAENQQVIARLDGREELAGKPILFLLNKKDLPEPIDEMDFSHRFDLHELAKRNKADIRVEGVCAVKGTGREMDPVLGEGVGWLLEKILGNYASINKGVELALKELRVKQAQDRLERQHRMASNVEVTSKEEENEPGVSVNQARPESDDDNHNAKSNGYAGLSEGEILRDEETNVVQPGSRQQSTEEKERPNENEGTQDQGSRPLSTKSARLSTAGRENSVRRELPGVQNVVVWKHSRPLSVPANKEEEKERVRGAITEKFTLVRPYEPPSRPREKTNEEGEVEETQCP